MKLAIVDFGFSLLVKNVVLINECTIMHMSKHTQDSTSQTYHVKCGEKSLQMVKSQSRFMRQAEYNQNNFHSIPLSGGSITYQQLCEILRSELIDCDVILLKGTEKCTLLKSVLCVDGKVKDLTDLGCPKITDLQQSAA